MNSSRSLYRTGSTGGLNHVGGARPSSSSRAGSAGPENKMLRDQITRLQSELMYSKAETQKVTDQLNCVISLIKRSWSGDQSANVHIANIIGMAPPDVQMSSGVDEVIISTKPKTRGINNWAVLTIGLLNREYKMLERELEVRQRLYLQRRQEYLEEQLIHNRDQILHLEQSSSSLHHQGVLNGQHLYPGDHVMTPAKTAPQERHCTSPVEELQPELQVTYGKQNNVMQEKSSGKKPPSSGLHRKWSAKGRRHKEAKQESNLKWADLVIDSSSTSTAKINRHTSSVMDDLYRLPPGAPQTEKVEVERTEENDEDRMFLAYDDPRRYAQRGLFDVDSVVGPDPVSQKKRPLDEQMRETDSLRARPKSAVVKQERPLKYETTRPISAHVPSRTKDFPPHLSPYTSNNKRQIKSAGKTRQYVPVDKLSYTNNHSTNTDKIQNDLKITNTARSNENSSSSARREDKNSEQQNENKAKKTVNFQEIKKAEIQKLLTDDPELAQLLQIDVTRPECIAEFDEDLKDMEHKERDFAKRAVELQKKLGIERGGLLYPDL